MGHLNHQEVACCPASQSQCRPPPRMATRQQKDSMVAVRITGRAQGSQLDRPASNQSPAVCWLTHGGRLRCLFELHAVLCNWGPGDPAWGLL